MPVTLASLVISKGAGHTDDCAHGPNPPLANATTIYDLVITVRNTGGSPATGVVVTDTLPSDVTYISHWVSQGNLSVSGSDINWEVGTIANESEATAIITVSISPTRQMALNAASVEGIPLNFGASTTGTDAVTGVSLTDGPTGSLSTPPLQEVRFTLSKYGPETVQAGSILVYTISYTNVGTGSATRVVIEDAVPEGTSFYSSSEGGVFDAASNTFSFDIGAGPAGMSGFITFSVLVSSDLPPGTTIIANQAKILSYWCDQLVDEAKSNIAETKVIVPFLEIDKSVNISEAATGDIIVYAIEVTNLSDHDTGEDVEVSDTLPFGIIYLEGSSAICGVAVDDPEGKQPNYTWTIDSIPPETTTTITYRCQIGLNAVAGYHENEAVIESYFVDGIPVPLEELPRAIARVKVTLMETKGTIIGKVFEDLNEDGWQDEDEVGVSGISIVMEDGTVVTTDPDGSYSIAGVEAGYHVLTLDEETLPEGWQVLGEISKFVEVPESGMAKLNFTIVRKES